MKTQSDTLPAWLSSTLSALEAHHPLRLLLPSPHDQARIDPPAILASDNYDESVLPQLGPVVAAEDPLFAFSPSSRPSNPAQGLPVNESAHLFLGPSSMPYQSSPPPAYFTNDMLPPQTLSNINAQSLLNSPYCSDEVLQSPNLLPFSTPGPCHRSVVSQPTLLPPNSDARLAIDPAVLASAGFADPFIRLESSLPHLTPGLVLSSGTAPNSSCSELLDDYPFYDELATDSSASDPLLHGPLSSHPIPFSTPGPANELIYFDSLTEDLSDPDPLQPVCEMIDNDTLDFRWEPFDRKGMATDFLVHNAAQCKRLVRSSASFDCQVQDDFLDLLN